MATNGATRQSARAAIAATLGAGVVVSCHPRRLAWARAHLGRGDRDAAFAATIARVGVEIAPAARGAGIGRAVVAALTAAVLEAGRVPYYSTTTANLPSQRLALGLGFWPAWTELYARDR